MTRTILMTGTSSGFGRAAADHFVAEGWNVIATLRNPQEANVPTEAPNLLVTRLDVEDRASIEAAVAAGIARFGKIDVVLNNAGYGLFGIFEGISRQAVQQQFDVNVFGAMEVVRAVLPHMRANRAGTIINVSSGAGAIGFPMASVYSASKFALEGWSEALSFELGALGIKVKIIEPGGAPQTNFIARMSGEGTSVQTIPDYLPFLGQIAPIFAGMAETADPDAVEKVIAAIHEAANDGSDRLRYAPTNDIQPLLAARRSASEEDYRALTRRIFVPAAQ